MMREQVRYSWLLNVSLFLAIVLQCLPVEADLVAGIHSTGLTRATFVLCVLVIRITTLIVIFAPLVLCLHCNNCRIKLILFSIQGVMVLLLVTVSTLITVVVLVRVAIS